MRRINSIILVAVVLSALCACDRYYDGYYDDICVPAPDAFLTFRNLSSDSTVWFVPEKACAEALPEELSEWQKISIFELEPHSEQVLFLDSNDDYETPVETYGMDDRFTIYIFKKSVWNSYSWQDLVSGKMWSGKCSLTVDEALAMKATVTYPLR